MKGKVKMATNKTTKVVAKAAKKSTTTKAVAKKPVANATKKAPAKKCAGKCKK